MRGSPPQYEGPEIGPIAPFCRRPFCDFAPLLAIDPVSFCDIRRSEVEFCDFPALTHLPLPLPLPLTNPFIRIH